MYSNFNVKEFENLKERSEKVFSSLLENIKAIKTECSNMSNIVMSDDSNLGLRWQSLSDNMEAPITNVEDTFVVVRTLLAAYVENTIANEKAAAKELEELDNDITTLSAKAENLLNGLNALKGVGFGATAIAIPGLTGEVTSAKIESIESTVTKYAPPNVIGEEETLTSAVTKYAPPMVEKYAPPAVTKYAPPEAVPAYAPPTTPVVTKYAPPEVVPAYAPPTTPVVTKYAPPEVVPAYAPPTPPVVTKYAPPEVVPAYAPPITPVVTKYAPPEVVPAYAPPVVTKYAPPTTGPSIPGVPYWMRPKK